MLLSQLRRFQTPNYATILRQCALTSNLRNTKVIHGEIIKTSIAESNSLFISNHLLNAYVKCGDFMNATQLFNEMPETNVVSWTALIAGFAQKGFPYESFSLFSRMIRSGISPNEFSFVSTLHACTFTECLSLACAFQVYSLIVRLGFESNVYLVNVFMTILIRQGMLNEAMGVFEGCICKDVVSWNAILDGYLKYSPDDLPQFWRKMISEDMVPDEFTFATVLTGLAELLNLEMGLQVHARLVKTGHGSEKCVGNSLIDMYLKNQRLSDGFRAFEEIPLKDECCWTQMASGCLNSGDPVQSLYVIRSMRRVGIKPNKFTLATGFSACANLVSLDDGKKFHCLMVKLGDEVDIDVCVYNAVLDMYAKCGCMDSALKVFRSMRERSVVSWTTMIMGYAQSGQSSEALEIFEHMRLEGGQPNHITFICVLYACSQGGFVDSGRKYFSSMSQEFGIIPQEDHYACMVNLFGRAGRIKEAEEFILGMPIKPSVLIWQTLLGACRIHGDVETAKRASEYALALDENDSSTYVLLSNTYADIENWSTVRTLRRWIENKDIVKMPGSSWLKISDDRSVG